MAILEWMFSKSLATGLEMDDFGITPVHDAAQEGHVECLKVFFDKKVPLDREDSEGYTPK